MSREIFELFLDGLSLYSSCFLSRKIYQSYLSNLLFLALNALYQMLVFEVLSL